MLLKETMTKKRWKLGTHKRETPTTMKKRKMINNCVRVSQGTSILHWFGHFKKDFQNQIQLPKKMPKIDISCIVNTTSIQPLYKQMRLHNGHLSMCLFWRHLTMLPEPSQFIFQNIPVFFLSETLIFFIQQNFEIGFPGKLFLDDVFDRLLQINGIRDLQPFLHARRLGEPQNRKKYNLYSQYTDVSKNRGTPKNHPYW